MSDLLMSKFAMAEVLDPEVAPLFFYQYRGVASFLIPLTTALLLFWVF